MSVVGAAGADPDPETPLAAPGVPSTPAACPDPALAAGVHSTPAVVKQVLKNFDNPEGAIFSHDGKFVFISNSAEIGDRGAGFSWTENEGYISKLSVNSNGTLTMVEEKLILSLIHI